LNIADQLRLIKEGYSLDDISAISPSYFTQESVLDKFIIDSEYLSETAYGFITESAGGIVSYIKKFFEWLKQKVMQFLNFIKSKFQPEKRFDNISTKLRVMSNKITKNTVYEIEMRSNIYNKDDDYVGNIKKLFYETRDHLVGILDDTIYTSKVVTLGDSFVNDENKFINLIFKTVFNIEFDDEQIIQKFYGQNKKVLVIFKNIDQIVDKIYHMKKQQQEMINFINTQIPREMRAYKDNVDKVVEELLQNYNKYTDMGNYEKAYEYHVMLDKYTVKLQKFLKIFNHTIKMTTKMLDIHKQMTSELSDVVDSLINMIDSKPKTS